MPADTEIAVIEMGANRLGDNAELCQFVEPTHGIATNAGFDHLEGFGTIENVFRSQTELYEYLIKNNGIVVANSVDEMLGNAAKRRLKPENIRWYGSENDFSYIKLVAVNPFVLYENSEKNKFQTQLIGAYNLPNIMVALAFGKLFDVPTQLAHEAVKNYIPTNNRSQLIEKNGFHIISDAYNANPSSMQAALENLAKIDSPNKIAIIGDMFEMGKESLVRHREILDFAKSLNINQLIVCGKDFYQVKNPNDNTNTSISTMFFETKPELHKWLVENPLSKGYILLKASRGIGLETILDVL
jgi:UDP-N-acetylmuramoyl-tripeptide--D-alanyl-D-alanine ligase